MFKGFIDWLIQTHSVHNWLLILILLCFVINAAVLTKAIIRERKK